MEQQDIIRLLLSMQEHPENHSDKQITDMLADNPELAELMEELALTKQAFAKREAAGEQIPIDDLWEEFATAHADELAALGSNPKPTAKTFTIGSQMRKVAAVIIGILFTAGMAFAAIHILGLTPTPSPKSEGSKNAQVTDTVKKPATTLSIGKETEAEAPVVFDNVPLDNILPKIASHYGYTVSFRSDKSKPLRLFLTWNPQDSIQKVIEKLNLFEQIHITLDEQTIIVE